MFLNNDCCLGRCRITDRSFCKSFWNATNRQNKSQNNPFWSKTPLLYAGFTLNILLGLILWQWQADHTYTHAAISRYQCNPFKSSSAYFCAAKTNSFKYTTNVTLSLLGIMGCSWQFSVAYSPTSCTLMLNNALQTTRWYLSLNNWKMMTKGNSVQHHWAATT